MKVLKIILLIIVWPVGLGYLISILIKKNKQKKAIANIDFDKDEKLQSYIELAKQEKKDIMKNIILIAFINYFNKTYPYAKDCEYIKPHLQMSKKYEVLGIFKNNQITQIGILTVQSLYSGYYKVANDCEALINSTKHPETFFNRYNLLIQNLERLSVIEEATPTSFQNSPATIYRLNAFKANKQSYIADLIARTTKQHIKKFLDYMNELDAPNKEKIYQLIKS